MEEPRRAGNSDRRALVALKPIENIVVGTSLRTGSDAVVGAAADIARELGASLTILHSLPSEALVPRFGTSWHESEFHRRWFEMQRDELAAQIERLGIAGPVSSRVASGSAHRAILEAAESCGADLIVIGASDRGRFARFLGGTADRVLRQAHCPVLVVRGDWRFPIERVLVPVDFSLLSAEALDCGLGFLAQLKAERPLVELFFAVSELQHSGSEPFTPGRIEAYAQDELERFGRESTAASAGNFECRVAMGAPAREILREVERFHAQLLVVATNGRGGVERALLGSVARAVATEAACAVLFIPPDIAFGAAVAEAVLEQTEPVWLDPPGTSETVERSGAP